MQNEGTIQNKKFSIYLHIILILVIISLASIPLFMAKDAEFLGTDEIAEEAILELNKSYIPWFNAINKPKSSEIESLFFSLQAAIGAGILGYGLGRLKGYTKKEDRKLK